MAAVLMARRFPSPWVVHEATESFCIRDSDEQALGYVYYEKGRHMAMQGLTRDEPRRIAANIVRLPGLLLKSPSDN
jgi:hypothetical protein